VIRQNLIHKFLSPTALCTLLALICGCAHAETFGERARKVMADIDKECRERQLGPYEPEPRKTGIRNSSCDILFLKPYDPLATPEGRFAHSIKLPDEDKRKEVYRPGMTSEEYFKALCEAEAGEFIFKTVENVDGIFEMRPREPAKNYEFHHLYAMEDPYGYVDGEARRPQYKYVEPERYKYYERNVSNSNKIERFFGYNGRDLKTMKIEVSDWRKAHYGFTWRGISRPHDRELGIAGGELIVLDLETNEVLGFRRGFARTGVSVAARGVNWEFTQVCPRYEYRGGRSKDFDFSFWFIGKVLRTPDFELHFRKLRGQIPWNYKQPN
jgi:hypothetical protein